MRTKTIKGQSSWRIATQNVKAYVTETGGHLAPVTFKIHGRTIAPFAVAPWAEEKLAADCPPILKVLRGDFFCMPFGGNASPFRGEKHPPHGETANAKWKLAEATPGHLHLQLQTKVRPGHVDKHIYLRPGHNIIYQRHIISGMRGPMNFGHHATLQFPDQPGSGVISTSPFVHGQVYPEWFERPETRGYQALKPGATFKSLTAVPTLTGETTDLSRYPARRGFEDLIQLVTDPKQKLGWTAVTFPRERYIWFALRDPRVLTGTLFWMSNGGRHMPPWNGRHVNTMGLEDVTTYFAPGLAESAGDNSLSRRGYVTAHQLDPKHPLVVNYIMGVAASPAGFSKVTDIVPAQGGIKLLGNTGKAVQVRVDLDFLSKR